MREAGAGGGTDRLARVMAPAGIADPIWAAEQFIALLLSVPQRRGPGLGPPIDVTAQEAWAKRAADLFLEGGCPSARAARCRRPKMPDTARRSVGRRVFGSLETAVASALCSRLVLTARIG